MKKLIALFAAIGIFTSAHAGDVKVESVIAVDGDTKPATTFASDVPKLYAFFRTKGTAKGGKLRGAWIAEDVGDAAPPNTKIDEATITGDEDNFHGAFSLSKPDNGWPVGKYQVEIYADGALVTTVKFTITAAR